MFATKGYATHAPDEALKPFSFERRDPTPRDVRIEILFCGICHSDLSVIDGSRQRPLPMVLGHEAAGEVVEIGPGASRFAAGDHVVLSFVPACGECVPCAAGCPARARGFDTPRH